MTDFKKVSIIRTNLLGSNEGETGILINEILYDQEGHETERYNYSPDGEMEEHIITRLENGRIIEEILEINGEVTERTTRTFDKDGKIATETRYYLEGGTDTVQFEYEGDKLISKISTDSDGDEGEKEEREYNGDKLSREILYNLFGNIELEKSYEYHENGIVASITEISNRGELPEKTVAFFDEEGRMTTEKKYDSRERLIARTTIQFDEQGRPHLFEEENQRSKKVTTLEYDGSGNNIRQEEVDGNGNRISLVERTYNESGHPVYIEVIMEPSGYQAGHHYKLEYQYE